MFMSVKTVGVAELSSEYAVHERFHSKKCVCGGGGFEHLYFHEVVSEQFPRTYTCPGVTADATVDPLQ